jgi:hypothetical protein
MLIQMKMFLSALNHLQGVLGKTSGRSYKAAPRQLLQVGGNANSTAQGQTDNVHAGQQVPFSPKASEKKAPEKIATSVRQFMWALLSNAHVVTRLMVAALNPKA